MSNAETVRRLFDAFARREVEAVLDLWHPEAEFVNRIAALEGSAYYGRPGLLKFARDLDEIWSIFDAEMEQVIEEGDRLVVIYRVHAVSRDTDIPVDQRIAMDLTFEDDMVFRGRVHSDPADALAAAGLSLPT